jgi:hypothetical protein
MGPLQPNTINIRLDSCNIVRKYPEAPRNKQRRVLPVLYPLTGASQRGLWSKAIWLLSKKVFSVEFRAKDGSVPESMIARTEDRTSMLGSSSLERA